MIDKIVDWFLWAWYGIADITLYLLRVVFEVVMWAPELVFYFVIGAFQAFFEALSGADW